MLKEDTDHKGQHITKELWATRAFTCTPPKQVYGSSKVWGKNIIKTFFPSIAE